MRSTRQLVITASLLTLVGLSTALGAETDGTIESRGLNLPRVSVPPPPPPPTMQHLAVRTVGDGNGTVTVPPAKACPPACTTTLPQGSPVVLAAIPAPGSLFAGWTGDCQGTGPCTLKMDRPRTVEATFNKIQAAPPTPPSFPNTVTTPSPGGPIPIPYPNMGTAPLGPELTAISTLIADGRPTGSILDAWTTFVTRRAQAKRPLNVKDTILQVQRQAELQVKARTEAQRSRLAEKMNSVGDDAQLANVELQNVLQKQQQTLQMMSNISKMMHDTAMAVIRKIGG